MAFSFHPNKEGLGTGQQQSLAWVLGIKMAPIPLTASRLRAPIPTSPFVPVGHPSQPQGGGGEVSSPKAAGFLMKLLPK